MTGSSNPGGVSRQLLGWTGPGGGKFKLASKIIGLVLASLLAAYAVAHYQELRGIFDRFTTHIEDRVPAPAIAPEEAKPALAYLTLKLNPYAQVTVRNAEGQIISSFETHYVERRGILSGEYLFEFSYRGARFEKSVRIEPYSRTLLDVNMYKMTAYQHALGG